MAWTLGRRMWSDCGQRGRCGCSTYGFSYCRDAPAGRTCYMRSQRPIGRFTWVLFIAIAIIFFVAQHELRFSLDRAGNFNPSAEEQITRVDEGSNTRRVAFLSLGVLGLLALSQKPRR